MKIRLRELTFSLRANTTFARPVVGFQGGQIMGATNVDGCGAVIDCSQTGMSVLYAANALLNRIFLVSAAGLSVLRKRAKQ